MIRAVCDQLALVLERRSPPAAPRRTPRSSNQTDQGSTQHARPPSSHDLPGVLLAAIKASVTDLMDPDVTRTDEQRAVGLADDRRGDADRLDSPRRQPARHVADRGRRAEGSDGAGRRRGGRWTAEADAIGARWPDVRVATVIDQGHTVAEADPVFLVRVLSNVLDNAAKAASKAEIPDVQVRVGRQRGGVVVRVVDHGEGLDPARGNSSLYPFYRLEERTSNLGPGLGLAIAKGFVDLMGGELLDRRNARRGRPSPSRCPKRSSDDA